MKTVCIYHSRDLDGWMSGAIVKLKYPDVKLVGWDYGNDVEFLKEFKNDTLIFVDVSQPLRNFQYLSKFNKIIWIDHHISAIRETGDEGSKFDGIRDDKFAACELTWKYFFQELEVKENKQPVAMPELVRLLGRYDCFGHKGTEEEQKVLEFQYGARQAISNVIEAYQTLVIARGRGDFSFDEDVCSDILLQGKAIYKYMVTQAKQTYQRKFDIIIDEYKFGCVNEVRFNPINFGIDYHKDGYDGFACFHYQDGKFNYSLYNDDGKVDCSVIAKNRGGGGHKGAAGFISISIL